MYTALHKAGVSEETFGHWQKDITTIFHQENYASSPTLFHPECEGEQDPVTQSLMDTITILNERLRVQTQKSANLETGSSN